MCRQIICKWVIMGGVNTTKLDHQVCRLMFSFFFPQQQMGNSWRFPDASTNELMARDGRNDAQEVKTILGGFVMKDALKQLEVTPTS